LDVDNYDYMLVQYDVMLYKNLHVINVMNVDRFYIFVENHRFVDNVDVKLIEMLLDINFLNPHHKNLRKKFSLNKKISISIIILAVLIAISSINPA
jgi:hypothetical protein